MILSPAQNVIKNAGPGVLTVLQAVTGFTTNAKSLQRLGYFKLKTQTQTLMNITSVKSAMSNKQMELEQFKTPSKLQQFQKTAQNNF